MAGARETELTHLLFIRRRTVQGTTPAPCHPTPAPQDTALCARSLVEAAGPSTGQLASPVTQDREAGWLRHAAGSAHCGRAGEALTSPRSPAHRSRELQHAETALAAANSGARRGNGGVPQSTTAQGMGVAGVTASR